jgi:hypothetical protein
MLSGALSVVEVRSRNAESRYRELGGHGAHNANTKLTKIIKNTLCPL